MAALAVFLDANALVPVSLADILLRTAEEGLLEPFWSAQVSDEAARAVKLSRPSADPVSIDRRFWQVSAAFPEAMVDTDGMDPSVYPSPHPSDQLVIAAAHRSLADVIVTRNLSHFPSCRPCVIAGFKP